MCPLRPEGPVGAEWGRARQVLEGDGGSLSRRFGFIPEDWRCRGEQGRPRPGKENPGRKVGGVPEAGNPSRHQRTPRSSTPAALNPCSVQPLTT